MSSAEASRYDPKRVFDVSGNIKVRPTVCVSKIIVTAFFVPMVQQSAREACQLDVTTIK